jgi:hypothetical protein
MRGTGYALNDRPAPAARRKRRLRVHPPEGAEHDRRRGDRAGRVISDCHFAVQLNRFTPGFLSYSVAVFLKWNRMSPYAQDVWTGAALGKVRKSRVGPEAGPTSAFYSCIPTGMRGPTCVFWASLTPSLAQDHGRLLHHAGRQRHRLGLRGLHASLKVKFTGLTQNSQVDPAV